MVHELDLACDIMFDTSTRRRTCGRHRQEQKSRRINRIFFVVQIHLVTGAVVTVSVENGARRNELIVTYRPSEVDRELGLEGNALFLVCPCDQIHAEGIKFSLKI